MPELRQLRVHSQALVIWRQDFDVGAEHLFRAIKVVNTLSLAHARGA